MRALSISGNQPMRQVILVVALIMAWAIKPGIAADRSQPAATTFRDGKTGKEQLSDKASDEQRVDDCKVSPARRTRARATNCPWDAGS
jgi:hypothetical protein